MASPADGGSKSPLGLQAPHPQWAVPAVTVIVVLGVSLAVLFYGPSAALRSTLSLVPKQPGWGWFASWGLSTSASIVALLPIWPPMCMASGLLFGFGWGVALNFLSIMGAAAASFMLGRWVLQEPIRGLIEQGDYPRMRRMMLVLEDSEQALKYQILFRFLFISMFIRNYGPATLRIPLWVLLAGSVPHSTWISIIFASLGASFQDVAELVRDGKEIDLRALKWQQVSVLTVSLLVAIVLAVYAHRKYTELEEMEPLSANASPKEKADKCDAASNA